MEDTEESLLARAHVIVSWVHRETSNHRVQELTVFEVLPQRVSFACGFVRVRFSLLTQPNRSKSLGGGQKRISG